MTSPSSFSLQEAQWLVKFYRSLPGQSAPPQGEQGQPSFEDREAQEYMQAQQMQAQAAYSDYPEEYYDEYW